jgi:hypothetical protein
MHGANVQGTLRGAIHPLPHTPSSHTSCPCLNPRVQLKLQFSLHLTKQALRNEDAGRSGGIAPPLIASALEGREWLASCSSRLILRERSSGSQVDPELWRRGHLLPLQGTKLRLCSFGFRYTHRSIEAAPVRRRHCTVQHRVQS